MSTCSRDQHHFKPSAVHSALAKDMQAQRKRQWVGGALEKGVLTAGVVGDPPVGRGTPGKALALAPHRHDQLLQADAVHALCQVTVPAAMGGDSVSQWAVQLKQSHSSC